MILKKLLTIIVLSLFISAFAACESKEPAEKAGEKVDQTMGKASDKAKEATEAVKGKVEEVGQAVKKTKESTGEYVDDSVITAKVKSQLAADDFLKSFLISVETFEGIVQLSGFVNTQAAVDKAGQIASSVKGVASVKNDLIVK